MASLLYPPAAQTTFVSAPDNSNSSSSSVMQQMQQHAQPPPPTTAPILSSVTSSLSSVPAPPPPASSAPPALPAPFLPSSELEGVTRVWLWSVPSVPAALAALNERLTGVYGATKTGRWSMQCEHLFPKRSAPPPPATAASSSPAAAAALKELYALTFSTHPQLTHLIAPASIVTASSSFLPFLSSSTSFASRTTTVIEGDTYALGDVDVGVGSVRQQHRITPHVALAITYRPCCLVSRDSFSLLQSLLDALMQGVEGGREAAVGYKPQHVWPKMDDFGLGEAFTAKHRALMFVFLVQLIKERS